LRVAESFKRGAAIGTGSGFRNALLKWFTAVVVKRNVPRKQARQEKRLEWLAKCHQIQYTMPPNQIEWVLLEWAERPAKPRRARVGTSKRAKAMSMSRAKKEAAETEVPWRYQ
jgi:hypothetical protein